MSNLQCINKIFISQKDKDGKKRLEKCFNRLNNTRFPFTGSLQYRMPLALHVAGKNCHLPSPSPVRNRADTTDCTTPTHWDTVFGKIRFRNKCSRYNGTLPKISVPVSRTYRMPIPSFPSKK